MNTFESNPMKVVQTISRVLMLAMNRKGVGTRLKEKYLRYNLVSCASCLEVEYDLNNKPLGYIRENLDSYLNSIEENAVSGESKTAWTNFLTDMTTPALRRVFNKNRLEAAINEQEEEDGAITYEIGQILIVQDIPQSFVDFITDIRSMYGG